jgi:uncharacterized protein (TIGR03437 family)
VLTVYWTGGGATNPLAPVGPISNTSGYFFRSAPASTVEGNSTIAFEAFLSGLAGVDQLNFLVPANAPSGAQSLVISSGGGTSPAVNLYVAPRLQLNTVAPEVANADEATREYMQQAPQEFIGVK